MLLTLRAAACNNPRRQPSMPRRRIEPGDLISIDGGFTRTLSVHSALSFRWSCVGHCEQDCDDACNVQHCVFYRKESRLPGA